MKRFMLKSLLIASLMFVSVLFGMQQAHKGIIDMKGYEDTQFKSAFTVQENGEGKMEASILGNEVTSHDLEKKREELEELKAYNFFSSIGKKFAEMVSNLTDKTLHMISGFVTEE
jgi:hypothetical protein